MKKVIQQYASAIISLFVGVWIFWFLFSHSFEDKWTLYQYTSAIIKKMFATEQTLCRTGTAFDAYMQQEAPEILEPDYTVLKANFRTPIGMVIETNDSNGDYVPITVNWILGSEFEKNRYIHFVNGGLIDMARNDVYWFKITVTDTQGLSRTVLVRICGGKI